MSFKIKLITKDLSLEESIKVNNACKHAEKVINSYAFKDYVLNYTFTVNECTGRLWWKKCQIKKYQNFWSTDLGNKEVYDKIMKGRETLSQDGDNETAEIYLLIDRSYSRNVIGYTNPTMPWQYIYNWFFKKATEKEIAGNLIHEWCHKLGFDHSFKHNEYRPHSVPYAVGDFVEKF